MFDTHYSVLNFRLEMQNDCILGENKSSALRGILGQALAISNCFYDLKSRDCKKCFLSNKCLGNSILSTKITGDLYFQSDKNTSPIIIRCKNNNRNFQALDKLDFTMIILGDTLAYIPQIIEAYIYSGMFLGIGDGYFNVEFVKNEFGEILFDGKGILKENLVISNLSEYIYAKKRFLRDVNGIKLITPLSYKADRKIQKTLTGKNLRNLLERRILTINALEGKSYDSFELNDFNLEIEELGWYEFERHSNRQKKNMNMGGIVGTFKLFDLEDFQLDCLIAGELIHIGKSTSFGFGEYEIF
ncbi:CRISPR system precrRNA processing endoribonuclease RAMP protein Cas6 [Clostridium perfringens]|uniref:CRISPR system precrRNA processing endoribonuclease RAMP protein Cas6 n=3 Tax=Clostridium perfringens TaxID=1502 RepID=UPI003BA9993F